MEKNNDTQMVGSEILENQRVRDAIEKAVLQNIDLDQEVIENENAFLRLVMSAKIATDESNRLLQQSVHQARRFGHSWATIGEILNISRQAAQQRFGPKGLDGPHDTQNERIIRGATAFNEMQILQVEGAAGYHLVSFGPLYLVVRHSDCQWEHIRITSLRIGKLRGSLENDGWRYVGSWFPFHYFKRPLEGG